MKLFIPLGVNKLVLALAGVNVLCTAARLAGGKAEHLNTVTVMTILTAEQVKSPAYDITWLDTRFCDLINLH
jgi:hypothetical protein